MTIKFTFAPSQGEEGREDEGEGERRRVRERTISRVRALRALGLFSVMCPMPPGVRWARRRRRSGKRRGRAGGGGGGERVGGEVGAWLALLCDGVCVCGSRGGE